MPGRRTLAGRFLAFTLIVNSLLLILLGSVLTELSGRVLQQEVSGHSEISLKQTRRLIDTYFVDVRARLVRLASLQSVINCMKMDPVSYAGALPYEREIKEQLQGVELSTPIQDVLILGKNGCVYNLSNRNDLDSGYSFTNTKWFERALTVENGVFIQMLPLHDQLYYSSRTHAETRLKPAISLAMAVADASRKLVGAIICTFDLDQLAKLFQDGVYEQNSRVALLDDYGIIYAQSDGTRIGQRLMLPEADRELLRWRT